MEAQNQLATVNPTANAVAIYQRMSDPLDAITKMGQMFASSGMFGCTKLEQGQVLALACLVQGKDPFELMQNYYIINGSLSMKSVAVLANFMKSGGKVKWYSALNNSEQAEADFEIGNNKLAAAVYTIEDAKREGLITGPNKHNWAVRPADMLRARLITKAVRMIAPGIIMGMQEETDAGFTPTPAPLIEPDRSPDKRQEATATVEPVIEQTKTLEDLIAEDGSISLQEAVDFCVSKKILEEGQTLADLTTSYARKVSKNFEGFVVKVREFIAEKASASDGTKS
jgi:hypothetical protein